MARAREEEAAGRLGSSLVKRCSWMTRSSTPPSTASAARGHARVGRPHLDPPGARPRAHSQTRELSLGVLGVVFEARPMRLCRSPAWPGRAATRWRSKGATRPVPATAPSVPWPMRFFRSWHRHPRDGSAGDRAEVDALLGMDDLVELMIARGSSSFIRHVRSHTRIPVMAHADGICHMYLHAAADALWPRVWWWMQVQLPGRVQCRRNAPMGSRGYRGAGQLRLRASRSGRGVARLQRNAQAPPPNERATGQTGTRNTAHSSSRFGK